MGVYLLRRVGQSLFLIWLMSMIVFIGVNLIGSPVDLLLKPGFTQDELAQAINALGLDRPVHEQYLRFLGAAITGDLGRSFVSGAPAIRLIAERLPATFELAIVAMLIVLIFGVPLGLWAGLHPETKSAKAIMAGSILGFSVPAFWQGLLLILVFSVLLGWLPTVGRGSTVPVMGVHLSVLTLDGWAHLILPALNIALFQMCLIIRVVRAGAYETKMQDFVKFARAKGLSPRRIALVHVLKPIMITIMTILGLEFASVLAYAVVTETIFEWPGAGKLIIDSINRLDRPVIVAYLMWTVALFVIINLVVDLTYGLLDPRVRITSNLDP